MSKNVVVCADDYGLNANISQAIINLAQLKRISASSCLVTSQNWPSLAPPIIALHDIIDIGLHLNFTEGMPLSTAFKSYYGDKFFSLPTLLMLTFTRSLRYDILVEEIQAQLNKFTTSTGFLPDFIDGHQHVHQLPQIRHALCAIYAQHLGTKTYIRSLASQINYPAGIRNQLKRYIVTQCGARSLLQKLNKHQIPHNPSFAGIYDFHHNANYPVINKLLLNHISNNGLIMCHPSITSSNNSAEDPILTCRIKEYHHLMSALFDDNCQHYHVNIVKGSLIYK